MVSVRQPHVSDIRSSAALEFFQSQGIPFEPDQVLLLKSLEETPTLALDWVLENNFNGVMAFNDLSALSFFQAALNKGVSIPEDLILCGFENSPIQKLFSLRIDTIDLSISELARAASVWLQKVVIEKKNIFIKKRLPVRYILGDTICKI